jgi:hypothetical protein
METVVTFATSDVGKLISIKDFIRSLSFKKRTYLSLLK